MEKLIIDNKVAVLYSPGFGAGWYSWNYDHPECIFDPEIVQMVLDGKSADIEDFAESKYADFYAGGAKDLQVKWLPIGTHFRINEYDGNETFETIETIDWMTA